RTRTRLRLQRLQRKRANRRRNWQHQVSRRIANRASTVIVEKLNTRGMTRSARGTLENPGTMVKAKSGLNREILSTGWYGMKEKLAYKCAVVEIDPAFTSQTCYVCGRVDKASRPSQAEFTCVACGHADNADLNAARNIMASGIGASARRGAFALATPVTREIDRMVA
ncbi:MAG: transposase, partial [Rhodobacteraceae bacterium]|nr:transposase [Paracoccaceae bacterium]